MSADKNSNRTGNETDIVPDGCFNVAEWWREKQEARDRDERLLASGEVTAEELARRNNLFSNLDFSRARIVRWRVPVSLK